MAEEAAMALQRRKWGRGALGSRGSPLHLMAGGRLLIVSLLLSSLCFAPAPASARKVSLALYYETLCPYCSNFIVNYLPEIFKNGLISIVDLHLVPYGNARVGPNATITCQHGPYECVLNTVEACAIKVWPDVNQHFSFVYCVERLVAEGKYVEWGSCFQKTGLDPEAVLNCYDSELGKKLILEYAAETDALQPPHTYVPWVLVDGQPLYEDYRNFESYICKAYAGDLPNACQGLTLTTNPEMKANRAGGVCYADKVIRHSAPRKKRPLKIEMLI